MKLLRTVVRSLLEAAITPKEAQAAELALYAASPPTSGNWDNADRVFILYSPKSLMNELENNDSRMLDYSKVIYGAISLMDHEGECNDASSVLNVAAVKGYGPLMYNIAGTGRQITPHREKGGVKAAARNVWNHFYTKGNVHAVPFDDPDNPRDDDPTNDCELHGDLPLDHSYLGIRANYGPLINAHRNFIESIDSIDISEIIERLGNEFYSEKYLTSPF